MSQTFIRKWKIDDVCCWLIEIGLSECRAAFVEHEINGDILLTMNEADLEKLGIKKFRVVRTFGRAVCELKQRAAVQVAKQLFIKEEPPDVDEQRNVGKFDEELINSVNAVDDELMPSEVEEVEQITVGVTSASIDSSVQQSSHSNSEQMKDGTDTEPSEYVVDTEKTTTASSIKKCEVTDMVQTKENKEMAIEKPTVARSTTCDGFSNYYECERQRQMLINEFKEKEEKYKKGRYSSDIEAFLDGAPGFQDDDDDIDCSFREIKNRNLHFVESHLPLKLKNESATSMNSSTLATVAALDMTYKGQDGQTYMQFYPVQAKSPSEIVSVVVVEVQNACRVFVRIECQRQYLEFMDTFLQGLHSDDGLALPKDKVFPNVACVYKDVSNGRWFRAAVLEVFESSDNVSVQLVDYGRIVVVPRRFLKALHAHQYLKYEPQVYMCRISNLCESKPTEVETKLLKELLDKEKVLACTIERNVVPIRIAFKLANGRDLVEEFNHQLVVRGLAPKLLGQCEVAGISKLSIVAPEGVRLLSKYANTQTVAETLNYSVYNTGDRRHSDYYKPVMRENMLEDALDNYIDVKAEEPRVDEYCDENRVVVDFPLYAVAMKKVEDWVRNIDVSQTVTIDGIDDSSENVLIKPMGCCKRPQDVETLQTKQSSPPGSSRAVMKKREL